MTISYEQHLKYMEERRERLGASLGELFPEPARLTLEIGCGHGHWLVDYGLERPDERCLGVDLIGDRVQRATKKRDRAGVGNVSFIKGEAMELLDLMPRHVELAKVFILFPDPWPKKRHWKNRLLNARFLDELGRRCQAGTSCFFRTDHEGYFEWATEVVAAHSLWERAGELDWLHERETVFQARADSYQSMRLLRR